MRATISGGRVFLALCMWMVLAIPDAVAHQEILVQLGDLDQRIEEQPGAARLYLERGELHRIHHDWDAATADYRKARELNPDLVLVDFCRGRMKLEAGHAEQAMSDLSLYLSQRPEDAVALEVRGRAHLALGQYAAAANDFQQALQRTSGRARPSLHLYLELARVQVAAGEPAVALQTLELGLSRLAGAVTLELEALALERSLGRTDAALTRLERLAAAAQRPEPWLVRQGAVLEQIGRSAEAEQVYRRARRGLQELPPHVQARGSLAQLADEIDAALVRLSTANTGGGNG